MGNDDTHETTFTSIGVEALRILERYELMRETPTLDGYMNPRHSVTTKAPQAGFLKSDPRADRTKDCLRRE